MSDNVTYAEACQFSQRLMNTLSVEEGERIVSIGVRSPHPDCDEQSCIVSIVGGVGKEDCTFTGNAMNVLDAALIARSKLVDARAALKEKAEGGR